MKNKQFDAIVIGSGAAGSFAAKELTECGLEVLLLEAGPDITEDDFKVAPAGRPKEKGIQLWSRALATLGGQHVQAKVAFYGKQLKHLFVNDWKHPYTTPPDKPFLWIRGKQLGGRLHIFGRVLLRWSDHDFKAASQDGHGVDWPISYADLAPYYDQVEEFLGVYGCEDNVPIIPNGSYLNKSKLTTVEQAFKTNIAAAFSGRAVIAWRYMLSSLKRVPLPLLAAKATGRLTIQTDAVVMHITTDPLTGKATGAEFVDRVSKQTQTVSANVIVICASAIESVRLLLNSTSPKHPNGLGNSSGVLGHYFMDQCPNLIFGTVPSVKGWEKDSAVTPHDPFYGPPGGVFIPRYENVGKTTNPKFARGFGYQGTVGRLYVTEGRPAKFAFMGYGEMLPYYDNYITLDKKKKDAWGIPVPHISCSMRLNEHELLREQTRAIKEMAEKAGFEVEFTASSLALDEYGKGAFPEADWFSRWIFRKTIKNSLVMGASIHESGGARMGSDPRTSVLNAHNQSWDVPNLFVTDSSAFVTSGTVGTTLTLMALTVRACAYIAQEYRAGNL